MDKLGLERHVLLHSSSNVHLRKILRTVSAHKDKQLYKIDGPFCQGPIVHIDASVKHVDIRSSCNHL